MAHKTANLFVAIDPGEGTVRSKGMAPGDPVRSRLKSGANQSGPGWFASIADLATIPVLVYILKSV